MSVIVTQSNIITVAETLETNADSSTTANSVITHSEFNTASQTLTSGTTPPVTKTANFIQTLAGGVATVDLTALEGTNGATVTGSGLKVQFLRVKNLGAAVVTVKFGAANPYLLAGAAWTVILSQNQVFTWEGNDATPDIAGGAKDIDLSGTGSETQEWTVVMG